MSRKPISLKFVIVATLLGNTIEWYDVATFGFLVPLFSKLFFPESEELEALMKTLVVFAFGSILRPVGGLLFGYLGDRYGRRNALIATVLVMTVPVFMIALLPTYWQIGAAASWILMFARMMQGIAAGGEFPGAVTFLVESAPSGKKGFFGSFVYFGVALGVFLGGMDFYLLGSHMNEAKFEEWGWRTLFIAGGAIGLIAIFMRSKLRESPAFQGIRESHETLRDPIKNLFWHQKRRLFQLIGIEVLETLGFNLIVTFSVAYHNKILHTRLDTSIGLSLLGLLVLMVVIPLGGLLTLKLEPKRLAIYAAWGFLILSLPLFWLIQFEHHRIYSVILLTVLLGTYMASMPAIYADLFPTKVRYSGIGFGYNATVAVVGGFSPLLTVVMIQKTEWFLAPALLLIVGAGIALITLRSIREGVLEKNLH